MSLPLKLKINTGLTKAQSPGASGAATPGATPIATPGGSRLSLKFKGQTTPSASAVPSAPQEIKTKAIKTTKTGRPLKPTKKLTESKKRIKQEIDSDDEGSTIAVQARPAKKVRLNFGSGQKTPIAPTPVVLKPKIKGRAPTHPPGEGYDSEASDREIDPVIEEEFVLRMLPGEDCEYLRAAISSKRIGIPKQLGGPDIHMKFFHAQGRRAAITIQGNIYAATLVDLPCLIEGMKSWDKRGWWKSADICQMLWVFAPVKSEEEAKTIALPKIIDPESHQYPHGLTPPMHYARQRRFKKRISRTAIEAVEEAVEKLLAADKAALRTRFEIIDPDAGRQSRAFSAGSSAGAFDDGQNEYSEDEDADAEGDVDEEVNYFNQDHHANGGIVDDSMNLDGDGDGGMDFEAELEAELEAAREATIQADSFDASTPMTNSGATPSMAYADSPAPIGGTTNMEGYEDSGDESGGEEDDDGSDDSDIDDEEKARQAELQGTREDILDLEKKIEDVQGQLATQANPILKKRLEDNVRKLKAELQLKKSSLNEGDGN